VIRFLLGDKEHFITGVDPTITVLEYLRENLLRKGTKESCATGDCGACTVVLGELAAAGVRYRAINSCITPLGNLHGKQLITVEDLKNGGRLHAVQQAMVDCHGSQCGFCTPGFVMSMFAHLKTHDQSDKAELINSLDGNLCRCTGYRPILDAAMEMYDHTTEDLFAAGETATISSLEQIAGQTSPIELKANGRRYYAPETADELATFLRQHPGAKLLAGGTDLTLDMMQRLREPDVLVHTGRVKELLQVRDTGAALEIGAAVTYSDCEQALVEQYPDLRELFDRFGSRQIRNQGTLGGNIGNASPTGDMLPFLVVVGANLVLRDGDAVRTVAVEDFFVGYKNTVQCPEEFIERIVVPKARPGYLFRIYKVSKRLRDDVSATCGAFHIKIENGMVRDASVAFGGMAEIPKRANRCEEALREQPWTQGTIDTAMAALGQDFTPISDFRASAGYRMQASKNLLQRLFLESNSRASKLRVTSRA
jgi:xanthine dehydrogenase small subunit